jgi:uncharacterized protein (TIGR00725 family)
VSRRPQVSVIGPGSCDDPLWEKALEVGRGLADAGVTLVCGGMSGVMEAAAKGAAEAGGDVVGIVPVDDPGAANPHCTHVVATGIGHARNLAVVASGDAVVAVGGAWGTLAEIGFARKLGRTVVALESWPLRDREDADLGIVEVSSPQEAVAAALEAAS